MLKRIATSLLAIVVISTLILGAACSSDSNEGKTAAPTATPVISELDGLYENTFHGFTIRYPRNWQTGLGTADGAVFTVRSPSNSCVVQVFVESIPDKTSLDEWARTTAETISPKVSNFQMSAEGPVSLGDDTAYQQTFTGTESGTPLTSRLLSMVRGSQGFVVLAACEEEVWSLQPDTMDSIIYSFRVTDPFTLDLPREAYLSLSDVGPLTLDPALMRDTTSARYIAEIFSGLVTLDANLNIKPDIAEKWDISDDGTAFTFHLRKDVRFHDGKPVTARDFEYSLERACDPDLNSQTAAEYLGDIVGVAERLSGEADEIAGVEVIDDYTLRLTIDAPKAYFIAKLTYSTAFVVDRYNVESGNNWWRTPNGTGPFTLKAWEEDELLVLERNDLFYGEKPKLEAVVFWLWAGIPMTMYEAGEIDITYVSTADIDRVLDPLNPLNRDLVTAPEFSLWYIGFNATRPPFDDPNIRQAFSHAINKDIIAELLFKGMLEKADRILPPGMPGRAEDIRGLEFDPQRARDLISESDYGSVSNLPPITFTTSGLGGISVINEALVDMWKQNLGVDVEIRQIEPQRYPYVINEEKDELFEVGWLADYPDPQNFLDTLFHSQSNENTGDYSNPEIDTRLEAARRETTPTVREGMYEEIEQILVDDAACLPLFFTINYWLVKPYVKGFVASPLSTPWLQYVSIEPED